MLAALKLICIRLDVNKKNTVSCYESLLICNLFTSSKFTLIMWTNFIRTRLGRLKQILKDNKEIL